MSSEVQRLLQQVAQMQNQLAGMVRIGTVHEVKGDKLRMVHGKDKDGQDVLGPWLHTGNHRGGSRETRFYKKGQNIAVLCPGGDFRQGMIMPYAPNKDHPRPEHANSSGQDEETYQLDAFREKQTKDGEDTWVQDGDDNQSQQQGSGGQQESQGHTGGEKAIVKTRMNKDGGITHRVGKPSEAMRIAAHKKGVKMKDNKTNNFALINDKGKLIVSQPWELGQDQIPDDNA